MVPGVQQWQWDFSRNKPTPITESKAVRFEADFFNIVNKVSLNNPDTQVADESNFCRITGYNGNPRQIQLGLKLLF